MSAEETSPAEELKRKKVRKLEQGAFRASPTAKQTAGEISEQRENCKKYQPGEDAFQEELKSYLKRGKSAFVRVLPRLYSETPGRSEQDEFMGVCVDPEDVQDRQQENEQDEGDLR